MTDDTLAKLKDLLPSGLFVDLTILCGDKEFKVHRSILWIQSKHFRQLLSKDSKEPTTTLYLPDDDPSIIAVLIHYFYHFTLEDSNSRPAGIGASPFLVHVWAAARKYEVHQLRWLAEQRLRDLNRAPLGPTDIDELAGAARAVDECKAQDTLWDVLVPVMEDNIAMLLDHDVFKKLLVDLPELNHKLLMKLHSPSAASTPPSATWNQVGATDNEGMWWDDDLQAIDGQSTQWNGWSVGGSQKSG